MNTVQEFLNENFGEVRVVTKDNNLWFIATDIAKILGLTNISKSLENHRDGKDKTTLTISYSGNMTTNVLCISEQGLYKLIFKSRKPFAEDFQDWICEEVIPSIRKNDGYIDKQEELSAEELMAKALLVAQKTIEEKNRKIEKQEKEIKVLKPKAEFTDKFLQDDTLYKAIDIAKEVGMTATKFNKLLERLGIQFKQGGKWYITKKYDGNAYTKPYTFEYKEGKIQTQMRWTSNGRKFILNTLESLGIIK